MRLYINEIKKIERSIGRRLENHIFLEILQEVALLSGLLEKFRGKYIHIIVGVKVTVCQI